jgi:hypothetical protein
LNPTTSPSNFPTSTPSSTPIKSNSETPTVVPSSRPTESFYPTSNRVFLIHKNQTTVPSLRTSRKFLSRSTSITGDPISLCNVPYSISPSL